MDGWLCVEGEKQTKILSKYFWISSAVGYSLADVAYTVREHRTKDLHNLAESNMVRTSWRYISVE